MQQRHNQFIAVEYALVFYKGHPLIDRAINYLDYDGEEYSLDGNSGLSFTLYEEREGRILLELTEVNGLSSNGNSFIFNHPEGINEITGKYYYEAAVYENGYETILSYGEAKVI